ncbi:MAG: hypothetical protein Q9217_003345 [Psora testacea]
MEDYIRQYGDAEPLIPRIYNLDLPPTPPHRQDSANYELRREPEPVSPNCNALSMHFTSCIRSSRASPTSPPSPPFPSSPTPVPRTGRPSPTPRQNATSWSVGGSVNPPLTLPHQHLKRLLRLDLAAPRSPSSAGSWHVWAEIDKNAQGDGVGEED